MSELTLESLARRLEDVERRLNEKEANSAKDCAWLRVCLPIESFRKSSMKKAENTRSGSGRGTPGIRRVILKHHFSVPTR